MPKLSKLLVAPLTASALVFSGALVATPAVAASTPSSSISVQPAALDDLPTLTYDDVTNWAEILVNGNDVERDAAGLPFNTFGGFGSVSCNNTSNLLLDYKEEQPEVYWRIMNLIFNPETGAGLKHIKVELGADNNTSSGTEPATKRSADEPANVLRGAGFHFIADAKSINPHIEVEALRWGEPSWTKGDANLRYQWYKETMDAAYDTYGVTFDYMSPSQNEVHANYINSELAWTVDFAKRLEADALKPGARYDYSKVKIVALDSYRNVGQVSRAILASPEALEQVDAVGYHYDIAGDPALTRLNKEFGMEVLYSEGVSPMIEPQYRLNADPARGGIGGTVGAVDIADRFITSYSWSGSAANPGHMTTFLFQPAVSAMYEGSQYSPKNLIRASDPWSGFYEGGVGITMVRHFMQFIEEGWEYVEGASGGDGTKGDGGTNVDSSTKTLLTLRTPKAQTDAGADTEFTQVHANNTNRVRNFEVKVANLDSDAQTALSVWETRGPDAGEAYDANYYKNIGKLVPVRTETIGGVAHQVYQVQVQPYSVLTLSTLPDGIHGTTEEYASGDFASPATDDVLPLPYTDDYEYAGYADAAINGVSMDYVTRRGGSPRYTADQNGAFEVVASGGAQGNVMEQRNHADNRGYTWNVWGDGTQRNVSTANPATVLGDHSWTNYAASIDFTLDEITRDATLGNFAGLGVRQVVAEGADLAGYSVRVFDTGRWELRKRDTVVQTGTTFLFDASAWHNLKVEARENVITATLDGQVLASYTDTSATPIMSGRISIVSGYYNTWFDNLAITPLDGLSWHAVKIDDADSRISYPNGFSFSQAGYAHLNRTQHVLATGRSFTFDMDGTGFNLLGATAASTLSVTIDDQPSRTVAVAAAGTRQTSYWLRGLEDGPHTVTVRVTAGTFTLDGIDVLIGGSGTGPVDPAMRPVTVTQTLPRLTSAPGVVPSLPATLTATSETGAAIDAAVAWQATAAQFANPYDMVKVDGTFVNNPSLAVSAYVEVLAPGTRYFVDANAPADGTAFPAVDAAAGDSLINTTADAAYSAATGWGRVGTYTGKGRLNQTPYDKAKETGWYTSGSGTPIAYRFTLPAGEYEIASGHTEWWNPGSNRTRRITTSLGYADAAGLPVSVALGTHAFPNGSLGNTATIRGTFTLTQPTTVTFSVAGTGGTEAPALSWIGINDKRVVVDKAPLAALLTAASEAPRRAYTADSWQAMRSVGIASKVVHDDVLATQEQVDAATAALQAAVDALVEVPYLPAAEYRMAVEAGDTEIDLPETVELSTISGVKHDVDVTWTGAPTAASPFAVETVAGSAAGTPVALTVEVVPVGTVYFVDAASLLAGGTSPSYDAVAELRGDLLRNGAADGAYDEASGWGLVNPIDTGAGFVGAKARVTGAYDKQRTTGWWASSGGSVDYRLTLPAGAYELTSGYQEWWGVTRQVAPSVTIGTEVISGTPVNLSSSSAAGTSTIAFSLEAETTVLFRAARGTGSSDPVLSWLSVVDTTRAGAPASAAAAKASDTSITVTWQASAPQGSAFSGYRVYAAGTDTVVGTTTGTSLTVTGLALGSTHAYEVVGVNEHGESARSAATASVTLPEVPSNDGATKAPGKGVLSSNDGWDTGLKDGTFQLTMDLWWGENGSLFKLYQDGVLVSSTPLVAGSPSAQKAVVEIAGLRNGTYLFTGELVNSKGKTATQSLTVKVTDANPGKPVLSADNWDGDGSYTVTADLWWGTNASSYRFLEGGVEVASGSLVVGTPAAQKVALPITGKAKGSYVYTVEFINAAGVTVSAPLTVKVTK